MSGHWVNGQWAEDQPETRAQLLSRLDPKALAAERERLLKTRHATAEQIAYVNDVSDAIALRNERTRFDDAEATGTLIAVHHPPSAENGWRNGVVTYEGSNLAWMQNFMSPGASGKFNRDAGKVSETIKHRIGERVAVLGPGDRIVSAADAPTINQVRPI